MSVNKTNRVIAGVSLEPHVMAYLDDLAHRMCRSRSWVLNTIVYEYAKLVEKQDLVPLSARLSSLGSKEVVINA